MIFQHRLRDATSSLPVWPTSPLPSAGSWPRLSSVGLDASLPRSSLEAPVSGCNEMGDPQTHRSARGRKTASFLRNFPNAILMIIDEGAR